MKLKKVLVGLGFAFGSITLIAPTPSKAGSNYDACMSATPSNKFSSYENMVSYCKCFEYVFNTNMTQQEQQEAAFMNLNGGGLTQAQNRVGFIIKKKCFAYTR